MEISANLVGHRLPVDIFPVLQYFPLASNKIMKDAVTKFMEILRTEFNRRRQVCDEGKLVFWAHSRSPAHATLSHHVITGVEQMSK